MLPNSFSGGLRNDSLLIDFLLLNRIDSYFQQLLFYGVNTSNNDYFFGTASLAAKPDAQKYSRSHVGFSLPLIKAPPAFPRM